LTLGIETGHGYSGGILAHTGRDPPVLMHLRREAGMLEGGEDLDAATGMRLIPRYETFDPGMLPGPGLPRGTPGNAVIPLASNIRRRPCFHADLAFQTFSEKSCKKPLTNIKS